MTAIGSVLAATVTPFDEEGRLDLGALKAHIEDVLSCPGIAGVVPNAHAGEVDALTREERVQVLRQVVAVARGRARVVAGVSAQSAPEAVLLARDAKDAGADAILLCPPAAWLIGRAPGAVRMFFEEVGRAGIPIIVFQYAPWMGNAAYDLETLSEIAGMENVVGVKEASWEVLAYERAFRTLKARHPDFAVLSANDEHLMHTYLTGCDGTLVVYAALTPALICELYDACKQGDYARARRIHDRLWPITEAVFSVPPKSNWCVRVKEGLKMMGRLSSSRVRSPLVPASPDEISSLRAALESAGLL